MRTFKKYFTILAGLTLAAISFNLFLEPFHIDTGGVGGLAIVVSQFIPIPESFFMLLVNATLVILSFLVLGKELTKNNLFGSLLYPILVELTSPITNYILIKDLDMLVIAVLGGVLSGTGYGLLFKNNFTSGGTDILNQIVAQKLKIPIGRSMIYIDGIIVLIGGFVFGIETFIYSIISLIIISILSNRSTLGINTNKLFYIRTDKYQEVKTYLLNDLKYDVTIFDTYGNASNKKSKLIMCSVKQKDYYKVKTAIEMIDKEAFMIITNNYQSQNANRMVPTFEEE